MVVSTHRSLTSPEILNKYFPHVSNLHEYLSYILQNQGVDLLTNEHQTSTSEAYKELLTTSIICLKDEKTLPSMEDKYQVFPVMADMGEVIDQAQLRLLRFRRKQNLVTAGYKLCSKDGERGKQGMNRNRITNYFLNTIITALRAPEWEALLHRIGIDAMLHILTETSIFVALPNGCLCQMTGEPILYSKPMMCAESSVKERQESKKLGRKRSLPHASDADCDRPRKLQKLATCKSSGTIMHLHSATMMTALSPADIQIIRARLFYAKPNIIPGSNQILVGLPLKHVFNRISPISKGHSFEINCTDPDPRKQAETIRHISKYLFPRQYSLSSPFGGIQVNTPDYMDRDAEIMAAGHHKTPKRLKDVLPLIDKLIWRHNKCRYKLLRDKACPSKVKRPDHKNLDSSVILEMMSERTIDIRSQEYHMRSDTSLDTSGNTILPFGQIQAQNYVKSKPRFAEFACSYFEVYRYAVLATDAVIPKSFWGSRSNFDHICQNLKEFIACRRYESLSLHKILQGFSTSACDWLMPPGKCIQNQSRVCVSDSLKRRELLEEFIFWYFDSFILPLLKTAFYVTESSAFRNQVLYFRQDDWAILCRPLVERLTSGTFEKMRDEDVAEVLRQRRLGFSFVRLLPKETGVRPIVNLRRKAQLGKSSSFPGQSINQVLQAAFNILTFERDSQPDLVGTSVFGNDDVYTKLKKFKSRLTPDSNGSLPKLYFVKVDVQACFDTIDQTRLLQILRELISEDMYMIQRYGKVSVSSQKIKRLYTRKAVPEGDHPHFLEYAANLAGALRNTIFVDQVVYPYTKRQEILRLLEEHITENLVKIGNHYYRQTVGIPQGSVLSSLLCCFFYGDLEKRFGVYTGDPQSVLLRLIDDYLLITTSLSKARSFLDMMNKGHPEYGCFISKEKTMTNFDYDENIFNVVEVHNKHFLWCGYAINMNDLSISVDYTRYFGSSLQNTLTVERGRNSGAAFVHKMLQQAKAKAHIIYSDTNLNKEYVVYLNIYQNFLLAAMKMHSYLTSWGAEWKKNVRFINGTVQRIIEYSYSAIRAQSRRRSAVANDGVCRISKLAVAWLGNHAFQTVLGRKPVLYKSLLTSLNREILRPRYWRFSRRFRKLVKEGQAGLAGIIQ